MVGVPRSGGCSTCIKRPVTVCSLLFHDPYSLMLMQCDESRPACAKCQTYGVKCPGYDKQFKFVQRACDWPQSQHDDKGTSERRKALSSALTTTATSSSSAEMLTPQAFGSMTSNVSATMYSPAACQVQCLSNFIEDVSQSHSLVPDEITIARWFLFIPSRLGTSTALDMAARCLTLHHPGITQGNELTVRHGRLAYGQALLAYKKRCIILYR